MPGDISLRPFSIRAARLAVGFSIITLFALFAFQSSLIRISGDGERGHGPFLPNLNPFIDPLGPAKSAKRLESRSLDLRLRHVFHHGIHLNPELHRRLDVPRDVTVRLSSDEASGDEAFSSFKVRSAALSIQRLADRSPSAINALLEAGRSRGQPAPLSYSDWTIDEIPGPNVSDKETVLSFARMTSNAYELQPGKGEWEDVGGGFNYTVDFGWESDGLRGHIFADTENATVVIAMKGTSPAVFDGSDTTTNDKENDNLFFSCCCGQGGQYLWRQVCDCKTETYTCNSTCLVHALKKKNRYYYAAMDLYHNVTAIYPDADIWVAGHSLGGSVSSLLALTYGLPVVTFEAPGEALAAARLGLPTPPEYHAGAHQTRALTGGHHFGHTADPIYMGTCNSASSFCTLGGYAMETVCHTGKSCIYDTVGDLGWRTAIGTHRIKRVIVDVIEKYDDVPKCEADTECVDCYNWKFFESNGTDSTTTTTTSTTSSTRTRTQTCKTPGWWGCLDEPTTTSVTTTTEHSTTTSTCKTPGWFGCKDPTTTTTSTSSSAQSGRPAPVIPSATITSSSSLSPSRPTSTATSTQSTSTCTSRKWFGLACGNSPSTSNASATPTADAATRCAVRNWYGSCEEWEEREDWKDEM